MLIIHPVPIFENNYVWVIENTLAKEAIVVDPGDALPVVEFLKNKQLNLIGILITHSHNDHIGGIDNLLNVKKVPVAGPACPRIKQITQHLTENDTLEWWSGIKIDVVHTPGHLPEHICFVLTDKHDTDNNEAALIHIFCGDIIFSSGCGRIFDGSAAELKGSMEKLCAYPDTTLLYGAHEYTLANIEFALFVEANNPALQQKHEDCLRLRQQNYPTLPTSVASEKATNPFLRCNETEVTRSLEKHLNITLESELMTFTELRRLKNNF